MMDRLQTKLKNNELRRNHDKLLAHAAPQLKGELTGAEVILAEQSQSIFDSWFWPTQPTTQWDINSHPKSWQYFDFDNIAALSRQTGLIQMSEGKGYCLLNRDVPIIKVNCNIWNEYHYFIMALVTRSSSLYFAMVSEDNSRGVIISEYVGYLPEERKTNNNEIVYELTTW